MRQRAIPVTFYFNLPVKLSLERLDLWMEEALEIDSKEYKPLFLTQEHSGTFEALYLKRLLHTTTALLQDICIPVFECATISDVQKDSTQKQLYMAKVWFPVVEGFPSEIIHAWLKISHELICTYFRIFNNHDDVEDFYQDFNKKNVLPWSNKIPGGKSTIPILQAAFDQGIPFYHLGAGRYLLGWGSQSRIFDRSSNSLDSALGSWASHNKHIAVKIMRQSGIPVPNGVTFNSSRKIDISSVSHLGTPLVLKPVDRDRGEGVTLGITSDEQFQSAFEIAQKLSKTILVEEQISGVCYRVLVVDSRIIYVVKRNPKGITGDGVSNIETLVSNANNIIRKKIPRKRLPELQLDQQAKECLEQGGLSAGSVLPLGQKVALRPAQSTQWGGDPEEMTSQLHPDNAEICIRAASSLRLSCAGVDFISTDIAVPWHQNGAVINEVNFSPVIGRTHAYQRDAARCYLKQLFPQNGRIQIDLFLGTDNAAAAVNRWKTQLEGGLRCYFISDAGIVNPEGKPFFTAGEQTVFARVSSLRTICSIDALVIQTSDKDVFSKSGYPFEQALPSSTGFGVKPHPSHGGIRVLG